MSKLESMKSNLFIKELSKEDLTKVNGGLALAYTGTCCEISKVYDGDKYDCSDTDDDKPNQLTSF